MSIKLAYRLSKIAQAVEQEQKFYQDRVRSLLDVYAEKDENGMKLENFLEKVKKMWINDLVLWFK